MVLPARWSSHSIRLRLTLAFVALLGLAALNIGAFHWGVRHRQRAFDEFRRAIVRHGALTETRADLETQYKRVKVVSDLLGVEQGPLAPEERESTLQALARLRQRLVPEAPTAGAAPDTLDARLQAQVDTLARSWRGFYLQQRTDPADALSELVLVAEPLAARLLTDELPRAIRAQSQRVERASAGYAVTDLVSTRLVWAILILSGIGSAVLLFSLSRDLLRAIGALKIGVERFGAGALDFRVSVTRCEELEEVGESLNTMAERLREARDDLELRNAELAQLAFRDPLTKLANRALFGEHVQHALSGRDRRPEDVAVLFIDLDNFKSVNDTLGHAAGDRLLATVAGRLLSATRGSDTVARLGGDEFAVLLDRVRSPEEAVVVAERILEAMRAPCVLDGRELHVGLSVGVACGADGGTVDELLRNADLAMYRAKSAGKGRAVTFAPAMHAALLERVELEDELRVALHREEFRLVFQPIVELDGASITGFEALVRWHHPRRGVVSPAQFIPLAEESGAILPLGRWVLAEACAEAVQWPAVRGACLGVSVNVSGLQLEDENFVREVRDTLAQSGLAPERLTLEITESVVMRDTESTLARLRELKTLGVRLAIDDFGTGYSSLRYLQRFPVDILKVDKAFVDQVARGGNDAALARAIVALGDTLRLRTVAEGIEHAEQHAALQSLGCAFGQGYLFSRPVGAEAARALAHAGSARDPAAIAAPGAGAPCLPG